ncbi:MAG: hypothetical protein K0S65_1381 [Labilithrix sp.]|nr:hypothetical protein [Labilithrix sp.]
MPDASESTVRPDAAARGPFEDPPRIGRFAGRSNAMLPSSLGDWLAEKRSVREVLEKFVQAGRGLAAQGRS